MYIQLYTICMLPKTPYKVCYLKHRTKYTVQCMLPKTPYKVRNTTTTITAQILWTY